MCMFILVVFSLLCGVSAAAAQNLEAVTLDVKFPSPRTRVVTAYDGQDTIYIWGGDVGLNVWKREIFQYNISTNTLQQIGIMKLDVGDSGSGVWMGNQNLLHFGGRSSSSGGAKTQIYNFKTDNANSTWNIVTNLPTASYYCPTVWDKGENTYIIGGAQNYPDPTLDTIVRYSSVSHRTEIVAYLPVGRNSASAVLDDNTGNIYISGGYSGLTNIYLNDILRFDPRDGSVTTMSAVLPVGVTSTCAVWIRNEAYIIGGYTTASGNRPHIVKFNPSTNQVESLFVTNFPDKIDGTGCVFVEKLNRIYILGGTGSPGGFRDQIMYIDFGPVDFECPTEEGLYPDPKNCRGFYNCAAWLPQHFCCPLPLFFNPMKERCDFQDMVECHIDPSLPCDSPPINHHT